VRCPAGTSIRSKRRNHGGVCAWIMLIMRLSALPRVTIRVSNDVRRLLVPTLSRCTATL